MEIYDKGKDNEYFYIYMDTLCMSAEKKKKSTSTKLEFKSRQRFKLFYNWINSLTAWSFVYIKQVFKNIDPSYTFIL